MDIKELNKSQLILLAVLLSFVTSIATGITTVTLMQQAPSSITTPVNRIIKQTIEKIEQVEGKTTVQTVIIKEEDLIVDAIKKSKEAIFDVSVEELDESGKVIESEIGYGLVLSNEGIIVLDGALARGKGNYFVKNKSGKFKAEFLGSDKAGFSFLKIGLPLEEKDKLLFTVPVFKDLNEMKSGQKILVLDNNISSFTFNENKSFKINITKANTGTIVFNLDGEVLGIVLWSLEDSFIPITLINKSLEDLNNIKKEE